MKYRKSLLIAAVLVAANLAHASSEIAVDEAVRLRDAGTIMPFEKLNEAALAKHPQGSIRDTELKKRKDSYIYEVELRDADGMEWELELDAATGEILKSRQED